MGTIMTMQKQSGSNIKGSTMAVDGGAASFELPETLPGISDGDAVNLVTWSSDTVLDSGDDKVRPSSPMVGMTFYDDAGAEISVTGLEDPITIGVAMNDETDFAKQEPIDFKCMYYDDVTGDWSDEGMVTVFNEDTQSFACTSSHLTDFAVMYNEPTPIVINEQVYVQNTALAACSNECSGHGTCRGYGFCHCHHDEGGIDHAWTQHDCSDRTCPKAMAWVDYVTADSGGRRRMECSNKGICDRKTGECQCFAGYDGRACNRALCPNNCNDRGRCVTQEQIAYEASKTYSAPWDALKQMGCVCDKGARGPDCSLEECPSGPDVLDGQGNNFGRDCSGRGICDYSSGICKCFQGYFGNRCEKQTVLS